jgi:23S rRNA pseudouridine2604 synthase
VVQEGPQVFRITLIQGLNRQIRRMCEHFGYEVKKLERVRIMNISLNKLPVGDWRDLTQQEVESIYAMVQDSSTEQAPAPKKSKPKPKPPVEQKNNNPDKRNHKPRKSGGNKPHPSRSTAPHKKNNKRR